MEAVSSGIKSCKSLNEWWNFITGGCTAVEYYVPTLRIVLQLL
jgi:hypothetical protein